MKQSWFAGTLSAVMAMGLVWTQAGAAYAVSFEPPNGSAPRGTGGASRGGFFTPPPGSATPREGVGGASRGNLFTPDAENAKPKRGTGGATRGELFIPPTNDSMPRVNTNGASGGATRRGDFFTPPPRNAAPQSSSGGATRGEESSRGNTYGVTYSPAGLAVPSMLAVLPDSFYGTTLEARPTILVYAPVSNAEEVIFSIKDEAKNMVYQTAIAVPESGGVMAIAMPADAPELAIDQNYQWYAAIKLDGELSPASPFVDGWVKRIAPSPELTIALATGNALSDAEALGANGIWYDTAAQLALLQEPADDEAIAGHWYELLESVGLADIASAPIAML